MSNLHKDHHPKIYAFQNKNGQKQARRNFVRLSFAPDDVLCQERICPNFVLSKNQLIYNKHQTQLHSI